MQLRPLTLIGIVLGYTAIRFRVESDPVVDRIDALLPQTQCGQCTYAGCRPYAEAIAAGEADQLGDISTLADPSVVEALLKED